MLGEKIVLQMHTLHKHFRFLFLNYSDNQADLKVSFHNLILVNKLLKNVGGTNFLCVLLSVVLFIFNPAFYWVLFLRVLVFWFCFVGGFFL